MFKFTKLNKINSVTLCVSPYYKKVIEVITYKPITEDESG